MSQQERYRDHCYHGVYEFAKRYSGIVVERCEYGPTEREINLTILRRLPEDDGPEPYYTWGYIGDGPRDTAAGILTDALGEPPSEEMMVAFTQDVVSQLPVEFRMSRGAVLRWARGWAAQVRLKQLPAALVDLPVVGDLDY